MRRGLLKVAARYEDSSPADVFAQVADAFGYTVEELEETLKHEGYRG